MAYEEKMIPTLTGDAAERFWEQAYLAETVNRGTKDLSEARKKMHYILRKSGFEN